ncbi:hypothetical protein ACV3RY_14225 [Clostridium perfringens]
MSFYNEKQKLEQIKDKLEEEMIEKASIELNNQRKPIIKISLSEIVAKNIKEKLICFEKNKNNN